MRRGASILEVMFAIMVITIGLLGAVAVFPVAASMQRKGRVNDATGLHGRAAYSLVQTRGFHLPTAKAYHPGGGFHHEPGNWIGWNNATGRFATVPITATAAALESWCIDPRFVSRHESAGQAIAATFPHGAAGASPTMSRVTLWNGLTDASGNILKDGNGVPLRMTPLQADSIFMFEDDLTINRYASEDDTAAVPTDRSERSRPAAQVFVRADTDGDPLTAGLPIKRSSGGEFSWMATLVPKHELYLTPTSVAPSDYVLSIVVFHQRPAGMALDATSERALGVDFDHAGGVGYAGGETYLTWAGTAADADVAKAMLKVRSGQWIMLAGQVAHTNGTMINVFRWYRVTDAEPEPEFHAAEDHWALAVSLSGQDWDLNLANQTAVIAEGVVGVYEKTISLQLGF